MREKGTMSEDDNVIRFRPREGQVELTEPVPRIEARTQVLVMLGATKMHGMTWKDVSASMRVGHGTASALLSMLHKSEYVARLSEVREDCKVYVLPEWVQDRETEQPKKTATQYLLDDMAEVLRTVPTKCKHQFWADNCRSCQIRHVLDRYDRR